MTAATLFGVRETLLPGPSQTVGYRTVLIIGQTGAGKTTLLQQLIGTDPELERFPSTSASKTTVAETEVLCAPGDHYCVVTFQPRAEIRSYVEECVEAAAIAIFEGLGRPEVRRRLLQHRDLRFRLHYIIGEGTASDGAEDIDDLRHRRATPPLSPDRAQIRETTETLLVWALDVLDRLVAHELDQLDGSLDDEGVEELLKQRLGNHPYVAHVVDRLMAEIELRFGLLDPAGITDGADGWPLYWRHQTSDRQRFLRSIDRFSSNAASEFGTLLTPLVNGIRVRAPFHPIWAKEIPYMMLVDGEGLGHTPESATSLPTAATRMFDMVDTILLVDNGQQPMQATAAAALRQIAAAGHTEKLALAFTHFDQVRGPNLVTFGDRRAHVMASVEQIVRVITDEQGYDTGRALRSHLLENSFFVGGIHERIDPVQAPRTIEELRRLFARLHAEAVPLHLGEARPVYSREAAIEALRSGVDAFIADWEVKLGVRAQPGVTAVHWTKVKALARRYAHQLGDEHDSLRPVGDLCTGLVAQLRAVIDRPVGWTGTEPEFDTQQQLFDLLARSVSGRFRLLATRALLERARPQWAEACAIEGEHAGQRRAELIASEIFAAQLRDGDGDGFGADGFGAELLAELEDAASMMGIEVRHCP